MDSDLEAMKKLTEVVRELGKELIELKKNYEGHGHVELIKNSGNYKPTNWYPTLFNKR